MRRCVGLLLLAGCAGSSSEEKVAVLPAGTSLARVVPAPDGRTLALVLAQNGGQRVVLGGIRHDPVDAILRFIFSPAGRSAYVARRGTASLVVVDGNPGEPFEIVEDLQVANDGATFLYTARRGSDAFVVVGGAKEGPFQDVRGLCPGPGGTAAYDVRMENRWRVSSNRELHGPALDEPGGFRLDGDGRLSARWGKLNGRGYAELSGRPLGPEFEEVERLSFSADGRNVAYAARKGPAWFVVAGDSKSGPFDEVGSPVHGPGASVACVARKGDEIHVLLNGEKESTSKLWGSEPVFGRDGRTIAYWTGAAPRVRMRAGGRMGPVFEQSDLDAPGFVADGRVVYRGTRGGKSSIVIGEEVGPAFDAVDRPVLSPDGRVVAYRAVERASTGAREFVVLNGIRHASFDAVILLGFTPDGRSLSYVAQRGRELWRKDLAVD